MSNLAVQTCKLCLATKPLFEFRQNSRHKDKKTLRCKDCMNKRDREYKLANLDARLAYEKEYYLRKTPEQLRKENLKTKYGISIEQYVDMLNEQKGVCAICNKPQSVKTKNGQANLVVDHCHQFGHVRGLLCTPCNTALGLFKDNVLSLKNAQIYLLKEDNHCD